MVELTRIDGIGSNMADEFEKAGFESAEEVRDADLEDLQEVKGVGESRAGDIRAAARQAVKDNPQEVNQGKRVVSDSYNPETGEYDDPDIEWYCEKCGWGPLNQEAARDTHQQRCDGERPDR